MEIFSHKKHFAGPADIESLLEDRYGSLRKWAAQLSRGDKGTAQEIVQDLCLYFMVSRPDLSGISNLDGYLYTSLRHIYLSHISKSVREINQFVSVANYDSIQAILDTSSTDDQVSRQNELRRICSYMLWRKKTSKSASYFILHFFHGYARREIAEIARLPMAAIYNKLKTARTEVKAHLENSNILRIAVRDAPPTPELRTSAVSSLELFGDLRASIFSARTTQCLAEQTLLALYRTELSQPISCAVLCHIVSCQRCLALIDKHFRRPTLDQRGAMDESSLSSGETRDKASFVAMMRAVRRKRDRIYEGRPRTISIAVNGRINATHNIQGEWNSLSTRVDEPGAVRFVEVFTDQGVRLALLALDERPPDGPHVRTQRVFLSDDRYLELTLNLDGLGLVSDVTYVEPALASSPELDADIEEQLVLSDHAVSSKHLGDEGRESMGVSIRRRLHKLIAAFPMMPQVAWALSIFLLVAGAGSYLGYRYFKPIDGFALLDQSVQVAAADLAGRTEHQILRVEIGATSHQMKQHATIDVWRDGDGRRYLRRVYNTQQQLLSAEWRTDIGVPHSWSNPVAGNLTESDRILLQSDLWKRALSPDAFRILFAHDPRARKTDEGYELTADVSAKNEPELVAATLILDRHLHPIRELIRMRKGSATVEARLIEINYERRSSTAVPDSTFAPGVLGEITERNYDSNSQSQSARLQGLAIDDVRLTQLEIGVLYQLNQIGADSGDPIEISRTANGRVRIAGTVPDEARKKQIILRLALLPDQQLLDVHLLAQSSARAQAAGTFHKLSENTDIYNMRNNHIPADAMMRRYLTSKAVPSDRMDEEVAQLSNRIISESQLALQDAYALDRLGTILAQSRPGLIGHLARQEWTEMVVKHSSQLQNGLGELNERLTSIYAVTGRNPIPDIVQMSLKDPTEFAGTAHTLLRKVQTINYNVGVAFTYSSSEELGTDIENFLGDTIKMIPSYEAKALGETAQSLSASQRSLASHQ